MNSLRDYYGDISRLMSSHFAVFSTLQHSLAKGLQNEAVLRNFLFTYVPKRFSVGTGFVIPKSEFERKIDFSRQTDVIIYDSHCYAPILSADNFLIVREDAAAATVEVKSTLRRKALAEALENIASTKNINDSIYGYIFAFNKSVKNGTIKNELEKITQRYSRNQLPDAICVLNGQFIIKVGSEMLQAVSQDDQLALFYYKLLYDLASWADWREIAESYSKVGEVNYDLLF